MSGEQDAADPSTGSCSTWDAIHLPSRCPFSKVLLTTVSYHQNVYQILKKMSKKKHVAQRRQKRVKNVIESQLFKNGLPSSIDLHVEAIPYSLWNYAQISEDMRITSSKPCHKIKHKRTQYWDKYFKSFQTCESKHHASFGSPSLPPPSEHFCLL